MTALGRTTGQSFASSGKEHGVPGMVLHWRGQLPRNRIGQVWRFYWWPPRTWAWEVRSEPAPLGYIDTGNCRTARGARLAAWRRAWGRGWRGSAESKVFYNVVNDTDHCLGSFDTKPDAERFIRDELIPGADVTIVTTVGESYVG